MAKRSGINNIDLDILFVLPSLNLIVYGGTKIIFELCRKFKNNGESVGVLYIRDLYSTLGMIDPDKKISSYLKKLGLKGLLYKLATLFGNNILVYKHVMPFLRKVLNVRMSEQPLDVEIFFGKRALNSRKILKVIATSWDTGPYSLLVNAKEHFHFIQGLEFREEFTGELHTLAETSFSLPTKKIVVNEELRRKFNLDKDLKVRVGINQNIFRCFSLPDKRRNKKVAFQLMSHPVKGGTLALDSIRIILRKRPDIEIVSYGNINRRLVPNGVKHFGYVSEESLSQIFNDVEIFVLPSLLEGTPLPGLEAMSCGAAVISTNNVGILEYIVSGVNGIISNNMKPEGIAEDVIKLIDNSKLRITLALNGMETSKLFSYNNMYHDFKNALSQ